MTRVEENRAIINKIAQSVESKPFGTCEEMIAFHLGTIATTLVDISKSLAILADKVESEDGE